MLEQLQVGCKEELEERPGCLEGSFHIHQSPHSVVDASDWTLFPLRVVLLYTNKKDENPGANDVSKVRSSFAKTQTTVVSQCRCPL